MRKIFSLSSILLIAAIGSLFMFPSCEEEDPCLDVVCTNGTPVTSGSDCICECFVGYEGALCATESRAKVISTWLVSDQCSVSGDTSFVVSVANGTAIDQIEINNFYLDFFIAPVVASITGDIITISRQDVDMDDVYVVGTGTYDGTVNPAVISFSYDVSDETDPGNIFIDACTSTWSKL